MQEPCPNIIPYVNLRTAPSRKHQLGIEDEEYFSNTRSHYVTQSPMHTINAHGSRNMDASLQLSTISLTGIVPKATPNNLLSPHF